MKEVQEKRDVRVNRTAGNNISIKYESTIELSEDDIKVKIKQLQSQIAHMQYHYDKLALDIESAKKELQLLQQLNIV